MTEKTIAEKVAERQAALKAANDERAVLQALDIIVSAHDLAPAPKTTTFIDPTYKVVTIGIGKDHTASLYVTDSDLAALEQLLGGS